MFLLWIFMLPAASCTLSGSAAFCPDPEGSSRDAGHVIDCLGLRFVWLHAVFDNFPSLLSFVSRLRCASGLCPRDLEDYGCSCRHVASGNPVDPLDTCCAAHRRCYQSAAPCRQPLPLPPYNFSCSAESSSCDVGDACQQKFCECDRAAIDCATRSRYNPSLRGLTEAACSAGNAPDWLGGGVAEADGVFNRTDVLTAAERLSSAAPPPAEPDRAMSGTVESQSNPAGLDGGFITGPPEPTVLRTRPEEWEERAAERNREQQKLQSLVSNGLKEAEEVEWEDQAEDQMTQSPAEISLTSLTSPTSLTGPTSPTSLTGPTSPTSLTGPTSPTSLTGPTSPTSPGEPEKHRNQSVFF
uniref:Phospholipase A2 n=1 Tax=Xiphophorus maculatus TaxID=8083 RepID=M3ZXS4_XIPMA